MMCWVVGPWHLFVVVAAAATAVHGYYVDVQPAMWVKDISKLFMITG